MAAAGDEAIEVVRGFLLNPHVLFGHFDTFLDFQGLFPAKYRDYPDVRLIYRAFQRHRHLLKEKVSEATSKRYNKALQNAAVQNIGDECLEDAVEFLEDREQEAKEKLQETHADIAQLEIEITRLTKTVEENCFADVGPNDLNMASIQKLHDVLKKR